MTLQNTLIDNSENLKLVDTLNEIINMPEIDEICIATGYWDLKGTALVTDSLLNFLAKPYAKFRLLIGKDPNVFKRDLTSEAYKNAKIYPQDYLKIDLQNVEMNDGNYQKAAKMFMDYCSGDTPKIEVHIFELNEEDESQFFHSKCYIFMSKQGKTCGIIGSSNFTKMGLNGNSELNFLDTDASHITAEPKTYNPSKGHYYWFNEKWNLSKDWTKEFVIEVGNSPVGKAAGISRNETAVIVAEDDINVLSPRDLYYKLLIKEFNSFVEHNGKVNADEYIPSDKNFKQLNYQLQAVDQAFSILEEHKGLIIADVVGLGKTFTALMIVKRFLIECEFSKPILIITPPALQSSWEKSIEYFDKEAPRTIGSKIRLTTIGSFDAEEGDKSSFVTTDDFDSNFISDKYGMVVVDESHRFRNRGTVMYQKLEDLIIENNPYVVLLSATPQNNRPSDIQNQIYLFEHSPRNSSLSGTASDLVAYFAEKEKLYEKCIKDVNEDGSPKSEEQKSNDMKNLKELSDDIRDDVLSQLMIRRTRTDLMKIELFKKDLESQNLHFPEIVPPQGIPYEMTGAMADLFIDTLNSITSKIKRQITDSNGQVILETTDEKTNGLGYFRYRAIEYLTDSKYKKRYEYDSKRGREGTGSITTKSISERLAGLMALHLVKRLESSRNAFTQSLANLLQNTKNMKRMLDADRVFICPDLDVHKIINENSNDLNEALEKLHDKAIEQNKKHQTQRNAEYKKSDFDKKFVAGINKDIKKLEDLLTRWKESQDDIKRDTFVENISRFMSEETNKSKKLVIFTECLATQDMLCNYFENRPMYRGKVLKITADNRNMHEEDLAASFDANYSGTNEDKYQILVTTDILAEGVNLHKANVLINYDSPWNSTRLMQRLGRINRIGSTADKIYSYNFYPSTLGDGEINLYKRTLVKLQAFHNMFGEDSQIYTQDEQLVDIERPLFENDADPKIDFIQDLIDFKNKNPDRYNELKGLKGICISSVTKKKKDDKTHVLVDNEYLSYLDNKNQTSMNRLQFCSEMRELKNNDYLELSLDEYKKELDEAKKVFQTQKTNEKVKDGTTSKGTKQSDQKSTIDTIKKLENQYKGSTELHNKLVYIRQTVRKMEGDNLFIKKINEADFSQKNIEKTVERLYKMIGKADTSNGSVNIGLIAK